MSYILEALQRADRERKRTQTTSMPSVVGGDLDRPLPSKKGRWLGWIVAVLLLTLWIWSPFVSEVPSELASKVPVVRHNKFPVETRHEPEAKKKGAPAQQVASVKAAVKPALPNMPALVTPTQLPNTVAEEVVAAGVVATKPETAMDLSIASAPVMLAQLPVQVRAKLPEIHISALIDHQDPARRVAWINDRALHIGQWVTGSVRLVAIGAGDVTLEFQGYQIVMTPFDQSSRLWR